MIPNIQRAYFPLQFEQEFLPRFTEEGQQQQQGFNRRKLVRLENSGFHEIPSTKAQPVHDNEKRFTGN
jgi:hypothetical protein